MTPCKIAAFSIMLAVMGYHANVWAAGGAEPSRRSLTREVQTATGWSKGNTIQYLRSTFGASKDRAKQGKELTRILKSKDFSSSLVRMGTSGPNTLTLTGKGKQAAFDLTQGTLNVSRMKDPKVIVGASLPQLGGSQKIEVNMTMGSVKKGQEVVGLKLDSL